VIKPVIKPQPNTGLDDRLSAVEPQIKEIKSLILTNESNILPEKQKAEGEIRTRVVASTGRLSRESGQY
jgi:hypothetical protein